MYTVFGAGSIGSVLGGFLHRAGIPLRLLGRREEMEAVRREGLLLEGDAEKARVPDIPVTEREEGTVLLCVRADDAIALAPRFRGRSVVALQNGVESDAALAHEGASVVGGVVRMTATLVRPGLVRYTRRGRIVLGRHPSGIDDEVRAIGADLARAGFEVALSERITDDKWLKLFVNLVSPLHALVRREDHAGPEFRAFRAALLAEALAVVRAAGVEPRSCDGKDPSVERMIAEPPPARATPVYNSTWRRLNLGRPASEGFHATIVALARPLGLAAPRCAAVERLLREARAPERLAIGEVACVTA